MKLKELSLEITQQCPNYCIHCSSLSSITKGCTMSFDKIRNIIDDAVTLGLETLCLSGGEPFLHPEIINVIKYASSKEVAVYVYTSGIFHDGYSFSSLPDYILLEIRDYISKVIINYEAADEQTYNLIMGTTIGGFQLMRDTINKCVNAGICVETHMVPMGINYRQIPFVVFQCQELGVSKVSFLRLVMQGRAKENKAYTSISPEQLVEAKRIIASIKQSVNCDIRIGIPLSEPLCGLNCLAGSVKLNIRYDGNVYPCEAFKNDQPVGISKYKPNNIYEKSLKDIYNSSQYLQDIRRNLDNYHGSKNEENCINQYYMNIL